MQDYDIVASTVSSIYFIFLYNNKKTKELLNLSGVDILYTV